ncbi:nucleoside deaminase [Pelagibius sp. Alg239-R121]|uniref:nucleoside deaminase n=1 Tax=Pelagibius sp. Alg239-R121 TaxID=2993448 RepID=UPI0024A74D66|nr:nucleoside deaminase [Pelagibius sp. Alg239-R121]
MNGNCRRKLLRVMAFGPALTFSTASGTGLAAQKREEPEPLIQPSEQNPAHYIARAKDLADTSIKLGDGTGYGAVLVKNGLIVGEGRNRIYSLNDPTAHSEIDAIRDACRRLTTPTLEGCEIFCSARPCQMCDTACYWAKLKRIHYASAKSEIISVVPHYSRC